MSTNRRDFIKTIGATSVALASSDLVASLVAQSPKGASSSRSSRASRTSHSGRRSARGHLRDVRFTRNLQ